jgi:methylenetetrahydrofolate reductase (NADPH)
MPWIRRAHDFGGTPISAEVTSRFEAIADDEKAVVEMGIEIASELCIELIKAGAPGIHFYTMNKAAATAAIVKNAGMR